MWHWRAVWKALRELRLVETEYFLTSLIRLWGKKTHSKLPDVLNALEQLGMCHNSRGTYSLSIESQVIFLQFPSISHRQEGTYEQKLEQGNLEAVGPLTLVIWLNGTFLIKTKGIKWGRKEDRKKWRKGRKEEEGGREGRKGCPVKQSLCLAATGCVKLNFFLFRRQIYLFYFYCRRRSKNNLRDQTEHLFLLL